MKKPDLSFWQIWNLSFGFLGVQIGYALQNANTSRILQSLGADVHQLSYFWLAAPVAGLIMQPIIGMFSDRTWTRMGRRVPFILGGAFLAALALFLMPNAEIFMIIIPPLIFAGVMLLFMDMAFNVTMQPFRALVADMLNDKQKTKGYAIQSFLINVGAIVGSVLPFVLVTWFNISNESTPESRIPDSVTWSYYIGGIILLATVLVTAFKTKEYPPKEFKAYNNIEDEPEKQKTGFIELMRGVPKVMIQLGIVQFFSWGALFLLWTYSTPAIAANVWNVFDTTSVDYSHAGDWVGILFGAYALFAGLFSMVIAKLAAKFGNKRIYAVSLVFGALGYLGMALMKDKWMLLIPMIGIGISWAAILAMPYSILAKSVQSNRMGIYMGVFNFTITIPQIFCGLVSGLAVKYLFDGSAVSMIVTGAVGMLLAAVSVAFVKEKQETSEPAK